MRVLHDWDRVHRSGLRNRGLSLLCYCLSKKYPVFKRIKRVQENHDQVEHEQLQYAETLVKLNLLLGVDQVFGVRLPVMDHFPIVELLEGYGVDWRTHVHLGEYPCPDRERMWFPHLEVPRSSWSFDVDWIKDVTVKLGKGPAIWHVDRPENLRYYIDWLYKMTIGDPQ